jgi:hypothetical protein
MNLEQDYLGLVGTLIRVAEANAGEPADDRILDAEGLAQKFLSHALSAFYLYRATRVPELGANFFDPASINVISRAALETFLVFHYIYLDPKRPSELAGRYGSWVLAGYLDRHHFPVTSPEGKRIHESDSLRIASLRTELRGSSFFLALTKKQQRLIMKGQWRLPSWYSIARSAGLNEIHAKSFYSYVCGYAHSGNLSVSQIREAQTASLQKSLIPGSMGEIMVATANVVRGYCSLFPKAATALAAAPDRERLVDVWVGVGQSGPEHVREEQDGSGV